MVLHTVSRPFDLDATAERLASQCRTLAGAWTDDAFGSASCRLGDGRSYGFHFDDAGVVVSVRAELQGGAACAAELSRLRKVLGAGVAQANGGTSWDIGRFHVVFAQAGDRGGCSVMRGTQ